MLLLYFVQIFYFRFKILNTDTNTKSIYMYCITSDRIKVTDINLKIYNRIN